MVVQQFLKNYCMDFHETCYRITIQKVLHISTKISAILIDKLNVYNIFNLYTSKHSLIFTKYTMTVHVSISNLSIVWHIYQNPVTLQINQYTRHQNTQKCIETNFIKEKQKDEHKSNINKYKKTHYHV